ncbi:SAICAR synthase-like protein [Wallemia mellicola]|uniref:Kinase n=1 Tax=Wallemia mellicola TaxID=1708541 RepID=A0A4T0QAJ0_9BASI|nr:SAICAR synthase-like protein [Wallemia mellicola]TIC13701.1 SAICAR synthase-like protein [Wallemia mellicola]TIC20298.1 SAICAR synthase-like protein [Wallemia mellicola]TIC65998.1 SAICAR synthase-like protein [Wallemia mellicola]
MKALCILIAAVAVATASPIQYKAFVPVGLGKNHINSTNTSHPIHPHNATFHNATHYAPINVGLYHSCYLSSMTGNGTNSGRKQSLNIKLFKESGIDDKQLEYISSSSSSTSTNLPQIHTTAPPTLPIRRKSFKLNAKSSRFQNRSPSERRSYSPQSSRHSQASYETDDYFDHPSSEDSLTQSDSDLDQSESSDYDYDEDDDSGLPSVPLKPFKNQVGGHHPIFRFSRRAVCKPLVRRENQFYESIERDHPLLLQYIPQYLGVLNVTFVKQCSSPTLETVDKLDNLDIDQYKPILGRSESSEVPYVSDRKSGQRAFSRSLEHYRTGSEEEIPQVKFERNTHLIPNWMLRRSGLNNGHNGKDRTSSMSVMSEDETSPHTSSHKLSLHRKNSLPSTHSRKLRDEHSPSPSSSSITITPINTPSHKSDKPDYGLPKSQSDIYPSNYFGGRGATTVNRRLQEQVLREVFSSSPRIISKKRGYKRRSRKPHSVDDGDDDDEDDDYPRRHVGSQPSSYREERMRLRSRSQEPPPQAHRRVSVGSEMEQQVLLRLRSECAEECALKAKSFLTNRVDNDDDDESEDNSDSSSDRNSSTSISDHTDVPSGRSIRKRRSHFLLSVDEDTARKGNVDSGDVFAMEEVDSDRNNLCPTTSFKITTTPTKNRRDQLHRSRSRSLNGGERSLESSNVFSVGIAEAKHGSPQQPQQRNLRPGIDQMNTQSSPIYHSAEILPKASNSSGSTSGSGIDVRGSTTSSAMTASIREKSNGIDGEPKSSPDDSQVQTNNCRTSSRLEQFLLMEDLTGRLKAPCVLDLKMGTRQYGVDATEDKKASQRKKAKKTTSHSLGLRLCGTQVYNVRKNEYTFQDKYFGRNVQANNFTESLSAFLYNGERILVHHIPDILAKLYKLARIISRLDGYRFYASSLLFLYDGDAKIQRRLSESFSRQRSIPKSSKNRRRKGEINIKIIDFAHCTTGKDFLPPLPQGVGNDLPRIKEGGYNAKVDLDTGMLYARYPPKHPTEPDYGYLIGLLNLCKSFREIWDAERERMFMLAEQGILAPDEDLLGDLYVNDEHGMFVLKIRAILTRYTVFDEIFNTDKDYQSN